MLINRITKICVFISVLFFCQKIYAQDWAPESNPEDKSHIGLAAGVINYSGFMNKAVFTFKQASVAGEVSYRYDFTDQFHVRAALMVGLLQRCNCDVAKNPTNYGSFKTGIGEISILPEYDFLNMSTNKWHYRYRWTPYIYAGPSLYRLIHYRWDGDASAITLNTADINLRWGIGFKYAVTPGIQLFIDGSRREFSKHIDFYDTNYQSRYYTVMFGAVFSLQKRNYPKYW